MSGKQSQEASAVALARSAGEPDGRIHAERDYDLRCGCGHINGDHGLGADTCCYVCCCAQFTAGTIHIVTRREYELIPESVLDAWAIKSRESRCNFPNCADGYGAGRYCDTCGGQS